MLPTLIRGLQGSGVGSSWETAVDSRGKCVNKIGGIHELRIEVSLNHREATRGSTYNKAEIRNEASVDTTTTETRRNRSVAKKRNDGKTTRGEAGNAERKPRIRAFANVGRRCEASRLEMIHHGRGIDDKVAGW